MMKARLKSRESGSKNRPALLSVERGKLSQQQLKSTIMSNECSAKQQSMFSFADSLNHSTAHPISAINIEFVSTPRKDKQNGYRTPKYRTIDTHEQFLKSRSRSKDITIYSRRVTPQLGTLNSPNGSSHPETTLSSQRFFHQFETIFPRKLNNQNKPPDSPSEKFQPYHNYEEHRCRFKTKILQIPKLGKYIRLSEIDELYEKCRRMNLSEAQWQLKMVELVEKRLRR